MCWADVARLESAVLTRHELDSTPCDDIEDIMEGLVFMESSNVFSRHPLHRRLLSARCSWVYTPEADFTGLIKACVCKYTCIHTCTSAQECGVKVSSSDPPGWSQTDLTWKAKFQRGNVRPRCSLCGIKECFQAHLVVRSRVRGLKLCVKESHENRGRALADDIRKEKCKMKKKRKSVKYQDFDVFYSSHQRGNTHEGLIPSF